MASAPSLAMLGLCLVGLWTFVSCTTTPKPCCLPAQWEGQLSSMMGQVKNGQAASFMTDGSIHVDTKNNRFASFQTVETQGRQVNVTVVELPDVMYVFVPSIKSCLKQPPAAINNCIPDNAQYIRAQTLGKESGANSIEADEWGVHVTRGMNVVAHAVVTRDGCLPLFQTTIGSIGPTDITRSDNFYELHEGIRDTSVFDVPDYCKHSPMVVMDHNVMSLISHHRARRAIFD